MPLPSRAERYVLLVEDNRDDEALTLLALRESQAPPPVHVARDGAEAIAWLERRDVAPARVVLLDLKLPRLDGFAVLAEIRRHPRWQSVPVVVMSSSSQQEDVLRSYHAGANSYVRKPVRHEDFQATVSHVSHYWLKVNEQAAAG